MQLRPTLLACLLLAAGSETRLTMPLPQAARARVLRTIKAIRKRWSMGAGPLEAVRWNKHTTAYGRLDRLWRPVAEGSA